MDAVAYTGLAFLLVTFAAGGSLTLASWKLRRRGVPTERKPLIAGAVLTVVCTVPFGFLAASGSVPVPVYVLTMFTSFGITGWLFWFNRNSMLDLLRKPLTDSGATLHIYRGLPGCGKTTHAHKEVAGKRSARAAVSRDDMRAMLHGGWFGQLTETQVTIAGHAATGALLAAGINVYCHDTNLHDEHVRKLGVLARNCGAKVNLIDMRGTSLELCLARNAQRTGTARLDDEAIIEMYQRHILSQHSQVAP